MRVSDEFRIELAYAGTNDEYVVNLQLYFHRRAFETWMSLRVMGMTARSVLRPVQFVELACEAIIHAATSLSSLMGQNSKPDDRGTPKTKEMVEDFLSAETRDKANRLFALAEGVRHFGPVKHEQIRELTPELLRDVLENSRLASIEVLAKRGQDPSLWEQNKFSLDDPLGASEEI